MPQRLLLLDYMRVGAAFLVIFGHLYDPTPENHVRTFIYQFHMPLFFIVSGMLHRDKPVGALARRLLWPVLVFVWFYYLVCYPIHHFGIWEGATSTQRLPFLPFLAATCKDLWQYFIDCKGWGPSWFIIALFYVKLMVKGSGKLADSIGKIHPFSAGIGRRLLQLACFCLPLLSGILFLHLYGRQMGYQSWRNVGYVANALMAYPYYLLGMSLACRFKASEAGEEDEGNHGMKRTGIAVGIAGLGACVVGACVVLNGGTSMFAILFGHLPFPWSLACCYLSGVAGTCMMLALCLLLPHRLNGPCADLLLLCSTSLMGVVGFQYFFCEIVRHTIGLEQPYGLSALLSIAIYAICILLWKSCRALRIVR